MESSGFNFTARMRDVCAELVTRLPELGHIRLENIAFAFAQAKNRSSFGTYATLTPMRFENGSLFTSKDGERYTVRRLYTDRGFELLYIVTFYMPRFMDVDLLEKLSTVIHELYHISPDFNGDIRRFPGRCYAHSGSQRDYDAKMDRMAQRWLDSEPPTELYEFLRYRFDDFSKKYGPIYGAKIKNPQLIRCA